MIVLLLMPNINETGAFSSDNAPVMIREVVFGDVSGRFRCRRGAGGDLRRHFGMKTSPYSLYISNDWQKNGVVLRAH